MVKGTPAGEIEIQLDCQIYDCRFSSRFMFDEKPIALNVMYSLEGDITTSNASEPIDSFEAMPDWRAVAKVKFVGHENQLTASEELSLNSVGNGYRLGFHLKIHEWCTVHHSVSAGIFMIVCKPKI